MPVPSLATLGGANQAAFIEGQICEGPSTADRSMMNEAAAVIPIGRAVARGVATAAGVTDNCKLITADGDVIVGISARDAGGLTADGSNLISYAQYIAVPVATDRVVACVAAEAGIVEGTAALSITAGGGTIGGVSGGAAGAGRVAIPGAIWLDTVASGSVGRVRIKNSTT